MIEKALEASSGKSVLFLGRLKHFTKEEVEIFLKQYDASFSDTLNEDVSMVIESTMLTPIEDDISYEIYKAKIPTFRLDEFESLYAKKIRPDSLLMALKLSNDQSRLIRLLKNEAFEKSLYLKLFQLYDWQGEEVHASDENRDVTTTFVKRFYNPEQFMDPAMIYSPITLMSIVAESEDAEVLEAMLHFPHYEIKVSKGEKRPRTLKEMIALNPHANEMTLQALGRFKHKDIDYFLSQNDRLPVALQEMIFSRANEETKKMLSQNANLSDALYEKLLQESDEVVAYLLSFAKMTKERLDKAQSHALFSYVGSNESIEAVLAFLVEREDIALQQALAANPTVSSEILEQIYSRYTKEVQEALCSNPNTPAIMIEKFAKEGCYDEILAANPSTPLEVLIGYFERGDDGLNRALASNESLPLEYLQQLQLDSSLMNILSNNQTFTKAILHGLGI